MPSAGITALSVWPSMSSIVRKWMPALSSMEWMVTMPGWLSAALATIEAQIGVRDGLFSRYRILIPPDRRRRPAGSVTEVSVVTNGRAVRMPSAVGS